MSEDSPRDEHGDPSSVAGTATPHSSSTWKVLGEIADAGATGVLGHATSGSGTTTGVEGVADSTGFDAAGVRGRATGDSGGVYGVYGVTGSADINEPAGVYGEAANGSGTTYGVHGVTNSSDINAAGVRAEAVSAQGLFAESREYTGVSGVTGDGGQTGVFGINNADTTPGGTGYGVRGLTDSVGDDSAGVYGQATGTSGGVYGVHGTTGSVGTASNDPAGVRGAATAASGTADGVVGTTDGLGTITVSGTTLYASGVRGEATATSGVEFTTGVYGTNESTSGTGHGVFGNSNSTNPAAAGVYAIGGVNTGEAAAVSARGRVDVRDVGAMAYRSSDQTLASSSGFVTVAFDQVKREDFGGFAATGTAGVYEVQVDGDYIVEWQIDWSSSFSDTEVFYRLEVDGLSTSPGFSVEHTENGSPVRNFNKPLWDLSAGQTIEVSVDQNVSSSKVIEGWSDYHDTFLSIRKFG